MAAHLHGGDRRSLGLHSQASESSQVAAVPDGWQGTAQLTYAWTDRGTQLIQARSQAPLKLQRPFYPEGAAVCHSVILHTAGGIVGGDRLAIDLHLQPQAQTLITTAAASKIYRSNGQTAHQTVNIRVAEGACLEWLPQETIVFNQAQYRQTMQIELAAGATWIGWDVTRFGRTASGEQFTSGDWRSQTEVWQAGQPLWIDRQWLPGNPALVRSPHGLGGCAIVGSLAFVGQAVAPEVVEQARSRWLGAGEVGVTRLQSGLLCRYRGNSTADVRRWFTAVWHHLRVSLLERSTCIPRVWGV